MKISINENAENFWVDLQPENMQEAAILCRIGMNWKKEIVELETWAGEKSFSTCIVLGKRKDVQSRVRRHS